MKELVIGRKAYDKIMYYVHKAKFEISGLGNVEVINGIPTVTDIILLKQENDPTETDIDSESIARAMYDHEQLGIKGELKFWWHSHVDMDVFWSGTDRDTIDQLTQHGWFVHGVFNKKNEYRLAYSNNEPFTTFIDNLDLEIDEDLVEPEILTILKTRETKLNKQFDELVTDKPLYTPTFSSNFDNWREPSVGKLATGHSRVTLKTTTSGLDTAEFNYNYFLDPKGAAELLFLGFNEEEVDYMQRNLWIEDEESLIDYEAEFGDVYKVLDDALNNKAVI